MKESFESNRRFLTAIILAALFGLSRFSVKELWLALKFILIALFSGFRREAKVNDEVYEQRMETCRNCPLYFAPLETCGSPLADDPSLGCWCFNPKKARIAKATCWMREKTDIDYGWEQ